MNIEFNNFKLEDYPDPREYCDPKEMLDEDTCEKLKIIEYLEEAFAEQRGN